MKVYMGVMYGFLYYRNSLPSPTLPYARVTWMLTQSFTTVQLQPGTLEKRATTSVSAWDASKEYAAIYASFPAEARLLGVTSSHADRSCSNAPRL